MITAFSKATDIRDADGAKRLFSASRDCARKAGLDAETIRIHVILARSAMMSGRYRDRLNAVQAFLVAAVTAAKDSIPKVIPLQQQLAAALATMPGSVVARLDRDACRWLRKQLPKFPDARKFFEWPLRLSRRLLAERPGKVIRRDWYRRVIAEEADRMLSATRAGRGTPGAA